MKYIKITAGFAFLFSLAAACNKHEIIPAPTPKADLETHFSGKMGGTDIELTENVNGYIGSSNADFNISANGLDSAVYYSTISSTTATASVTVGHGSIEYDNGSSSTPTLSLFNNFFNNNLLPVFSNNGVNGFTVTYIDSQGRAWKSNEAHSYPSESVSYFNVSQESDNTGDYHKFNVSFNTYVYRTNPLTLDIDSLLITDAVYKGWYKR